MHKSNNFRYTLLNYIFTYIIIISMRRAIYKRNPSKAIGITIATVLVTGALFCTGFFVAPGCEQPPCVERPGARQRTAVRRRLVREEDHTRHSLHRALDDQAERHAAGGPAQVDAVLRADHRGVSVWRVWRRLSESGYDICRILITSRRQRRREGASEGSSGGRPSFS